MTLQSSSDGRYKNPVAGKFDANFMSWENQYHVRLCSIMKVYCYIILLASLQNNHARLLRNDGGKFEPSLKIPSNILNPKQFSEFVVRNQVQQPVQKPKLFSPTPLPKVRKTPAPTLHGLKVQIGPPVLTPTTPRSGQKGWLTPAPKGAKVPFPLNMQDELQAPPAPSEVAIKNRVKKTPPKMKLKRKRKARKTSDKGGILFRPISLSGVYFKPTRFKKDTKILKTEKPTFKPTTTPITKVKIFSASPTLGDLTKTKAPVIGVKFRPTVPTTPASTVKFKSSLPITITESVTESPIYREDVTPVSPTIAPTTYVPAPTILPSIDNYNPIHTDFAEDFSIPGNIKQNIEDALLGSFQAFGKRIAPVKKLVGTWEHTQNIVPLPPQPPKLPTLPQKGRFYKVKQKPNRNHIRRL